MKATLNHKIIVGVITFLLLTLVFAPTIHGRSSDQQAEQKILDIIENISIRFPKIEPTEQQIPKNLNQRDNLVHLNLPDAAVILNVHHTGPVSYFSSTLSDIPEGYDVTNGTYVGWCTDLDHTIQSNYPYPSTLYNSYNTTLPSHLQHQNWSMVNYIINNKQGSDWWQVQYALYYILDFGDQGLNTDGWAMVTNASAYGTGFIPGLGDIIAVIVDAGQNIQRTIIELAIPEYTLTVQIVGNGSVNIDPNQSTYLYDSIVNLTAIPDLGWSFDAWSGDLTGSSNPGSIVMDGDKSVTATFSEDLYTLTITVVGNGSVVKVPDQSSYLYGTVVTLSANADLGWSFDAWSGDLSGSSNPGSIVMDGDKSVTATFSEDLYTLTITVVGNGSVVKVPDQSSYVYGTVVTLSANADLGWSFDAWSGDVTGSSNPGSIVMDDDKSVTATFSEDLYTLTITVVGNGSVVKVPDQSSYVYGTVVTLSANADLGWSFDAWSGDLSGSSNPGSIVMDGDKSVTATFSEDLYTLTITVVGNGSVVKVPDQSSYVYGTVVSLTANADLGWSFDAWSGDVTGSSNPGSIVMDDDKSVTATFSEDQYILNISIVGTGNVNLDPQQTYYTYGTIVTLTAAPCPWWHFSHWSGDLTGTSNPETLFMDGDKNITAHFEIDEYALTINIDGNGSVMKDPDQTTYLAGTLVNLTAIADEGWQFIEWSGDITGTTNPTFIVMSSNATVTAHFGNEFTLNITIEGQGTVIKDPDQPTYLFGTTVELTAIPESGWKFSTWQGDITGSTNPEQLLIDGNMMVTAVFEESPDTTPPLIEITSPENAIYILAQRILPFKLPLIFLGVKIAVNASDNDSGIGRVEFYIDEELISTDTEAPFEYNWKSSESMQIRHTIKATAYDNAGNEASDEIDVMRWRFHPVLIAFFLFVAAVMYRFGG